MISLIICSRHSFISPELENNIDETIGVDYEIILIDNSANQYSIFEAYNMGVSKSNYPYLCFMHDDILYYTSNWGQQVIDYFKDEQTGAIGIAGTPYAAQMPGAWWGGRLVYEQLVTKPGDPHELLTKYVEEVDASNKKEVVILDGVWLCIRKKLFDKIKFDTSLFHGYHYYDADICLQIFLSGYQLYSVFNILIFHSSNGNTNINWCENALIFQKKWQPVLPVSCIKLPYEKRCDAELKTLNEFIYITLLNKIPTKDVLKSAIQRIIRFYRGYFYYKTPAYFLIYLTKYLKTAVQKQLHN